MTYREIEEGIQALRNIVGADDLRQENQELRATIKKLRQALKNTQATHEKEINRKDSEIVLLKVENSRLKDLHVKYKRKNYSEEAFDSLVNERFNEKVENHINEEAEKFYLRDRAKLVRQEIQSYPKSCSEETWNMINSCVNQEVAGILYNKDRWPPKFKQYFGECARRFADSLKDQDYLVDVDREANQRLESLKHGEWRMYIEAFQRDTLDPFLRNNLQTQLRTLSGSFQVTCPHCGILNLVVLTPDNLATLTKGQLFVSCAYCRGFWGGAKRFPLDLGAVYWCLTQGHYMAENPPQIIRLICKSGKPENPQNENSKEGFE